MVVVTNLEIPVASEKDIQKPEREERGEYKQACIKVSSLLGQIGVFRKAEKSVKETEEGGKEHAVMTVYSRDDYTQDYDEILRKRKEEKQRKKREREERRGEEEDKEEGQEEGKKEESTSLDKFRPITAIKARMVDKERICLTGVWQSEKGKISFEFYAQQFPDDLDEPIKTGEVSIAPYRKALDRSQWQKVSKTDKGTELLEGVAKALTDELSRKE